MWNGKTRPEGFDVTAQHGLGLQLIPGVVAHQLGGTLVLRHCSDGTAAEIVIGDGDITSE